MQQWQGDEISFFSSLTGQVDCKVIKTNSLTINFSCVIDSGKSAQSGENSLSEGAGVTDYSSLQQAAFGERGSKQNNVFSLGS